MLTYLLFRTDWRGLLVVSLGSAWPARSRLIPTLVEENVETDASTVGIRMTEFYGLSREDWLSLVIKVSCLDFAPRKELNVSTAVS